VQSASHSPSALLVVQATWQVRFACTAQEALQLVWHCVAQLAVGGIAEHWTPQRLVQSSVQSLSQAAPAPAQAPAQLA
jgi:hypothetical protein